MKGRCPRQAQRPICKTALRLGLPESFSSTSHMQSPSICVIESRPLCAYRQLWLAWPRILSTRRFEDSFAMFRLKKLSKTKSTSDELLRRLFTIKTSNIRGWLCIFTSTMFLALEDPDLPEDLHCAIRQSTGHCGVEVRHLYKWRSRKMRCSQKSVATSEGCLRELARSRHLAAELCRVRYCGLATT